MRRHHQKTRAVCHHRQHHRRWPTRLRRSQRRNPPGRRGRPREEEALVTTVWRRRCSRTAHLRVRSSSSPTGRCVTRERRNAEENKMYKCKVILFVSCRPTLPPTIPPTRVLHASHIAPRDTMRCRASLGNAASQLETEPQPTPRSRLTYVAELTQRQAWEDHRRHGLCGSIQLFPNQRRRRQSCAGHQDGGGYSYCTLYCTHCTRRHARCVHSRHA